MHVVANKSAVLIAATVTALFFGHMPIQAMAQSPATPAAPATKPAAKTADQPPAKSDAKKITAKTSLCKPEKGMPVKVKLTTSMGAITLELDSEKAPISTGNFIQYVESGHYNGTIFHRVIGNFMVQGGGMTKDMQQKPTKPQIKNESTNGLKNDLYTVAMARTGVRDSATSQFFINVKNNDFLNYSGETQAGYGYAVFGKVIEGTEVVDKIKAVKTGAQDVPVETITIEKAECL